MEHWNHKSLQQHRFQNRRERQNPSFSSSLLDQIYRSIDQTHGLDEHEQGILVQTTIMKQTNCKTTVFGEKEELDLANFQRACLIEKWMDQKKKLSSENILIRKKPASAREFGRNSRQNRDSILLNSSSSSSDSSCGGLFLSEAESNYGVSSKSSSYTNHRPKPIRTSFSTQPERFNNEKINLSRQKSKHEGGGFEKTKLKMYGDQKKVRKPISPGGRLANFLNSIFSGSAANAKKAKIYQEEASLERKSKSAQASTCSSASSFSRSCLSKTPSSSGGKSTKRSVRFYPVSVIVDEDCQPCGHKSLYQDKGRQNNSHNNNKNNNINIPSARNSISEEISFHIREKNRCIEEAARDLLNNYQRKVECQIMEDDDGASYASSDLFELDNLSAIGGIERYCKELPVYETTYFDTNQSIVSGLIM